MPSCALKRCAQLLEIKDFPIEYDPRLLIPARHGLVATRREIENRQAPVAKPDAGALPFIQEHAGIVGTPVGHAVTHRDDYRLVDCDIAAP
jgi:hypothetical protein